MGIINLAEPWPRYRKQIKARRYFPAEAIVSLPRLKTSNLGSLEKALSNRRSAREFKKPLNLAQLGCLLWFCYRTRRQRLQAGEVVWESRVTPSGGGCYPVDLLMLSTEWDRRALLFYDPNYHSALVSWLPARILDQSIVNVSQCLEVGRGTILWFVADLGRSGRKYRHPESLVWRDSGALLATIGLVCSGMGFKCCGLGIHDVTPLRNFLRLDENLVGVGGCVVSAA